MSEPALKCENNASFKQINTLKLLIAFKMAYSCCFSLEGNQDFPEFIQKNFYNINYWTRLTSGLYFNKLLQVDKTGRFYFRESFTTTPSDKYHQRISKITSSILAQKRRRRQYR